MISIKHPFHHDKLYPITTVLRDLASQENCDGEPYDQMIEAANEIDRLERLLEEVQHYFQPRAGDKPCE